MMLLAGMLEACCILIVLGILVGGYELLWEELPRTRAARAVTAICAELLVMAIAGVLVVASIVVGNGDG